MKKIIDFLTALQANNNRDWFMAHKAEYLACKARFDEFTERLIAGIREFDDTIGPLTAKGFALDFEGALKRIPRGFPQDESYSDWLRLKSFCLVKSPGKKYMLREDLLEQALKDFRTTTPFLRFINRAVEYAVHPAEVAVADQSLYLYNPHPQLR